MATTLYADLPERKREVYSLLLEACNALRREGKPRGALRIHDQGYDEAQEAVVR